MQKRSCTAYGEIISFQVTSGYQAVYYEKKDGFLEFWSEPLDGIALCRSYTQHYLVDESGKRTFTQQSDFYNEIVGILLLEGEGYFDIVETTSNYAGMCRVGSDITVCTGGMSSELWDLPRRLSDDE